METRVKNLYNVYAILKEDIAKQHSVSPGDILVGKSSIGNWTYIVVGLIEEPDAKQQAFHAIWTDGKETCWLSPVTLLKNRLAKL